MKHKTINTVKKLANYLNINKEILVALSTNDYNIIETYEYPDEILSDVLTVKKIKIKKRSGGFRAVYSPSSDNLTNCLKILNSKLKTIYSAPSCVHGYIKGRGIRTNASEHLGKMYILKIDIKDYFEKVTYENIIKSLDHLGFHNEISSLIAKISTHNNVLVQGFHTSPTIANIVFNELDLTFSKFPNIQYTRYADDLYFSSDEEINILQEVEDQLLKFGFKINKSKTKLMKRGQKQYVTGLTVFDFLKPRISKHKKKEIRQLMHYIKKYGFRGHIMHRYGFSNEDYLKDDDIKQKVDLMIESLKSKIKGWLLFINSIEPDFSKKYMTIKK